MLDTSWECCSTHSCIWVPASSSHKYPLPWQIIPGPEQAAILTFSSYLESPSSQPISTLSIAPCFSSKSMWFSYSVLLSNNPYLISPFIFLLFLCLVASFIFCEFNTTHMVLGSSFVLFSECLRSLIYVGIICCCFWGVVLCCGALLNEMVHRKSCWSMINHCFQPWSLIVQNWLPSYFS